MTSVSRSQVSYLLGRHGGFFDGPQDNHFNISEANFWAFLRDYGGLVLKETQRDAAARAATAEDHHHDA